MDPDRNHHAEIPEWVTKRRRTRTVIPPGWAVGMNDLDRKALIVNNLFVTEVGYAYIPGTLIMERT